MSTVILLIIAVSAVFVTGAIAGVVLIFVAAAIRTEERAARSRTYRSVLLADEPPGAMSRGVRRLTGIGHAAEEGLQHDVDLENNWNSANSEIENTYKRMGPPPPADPAGGRGE